MIDLRKSIFNENNSLEISTINQNLQILYVKRLLGIVNDKINYDNISKSSSYYNLNWLKSNLNTNSSNFTSKQHNKYLLHLINNGLEIE